MKKCFRDANLPISLKFKNGKFSKEIITTLLMVFLGAFRDGNNYFE